MQVEARTMTEVKQWLVIQGMLKKRTKIYTQLAICSRCCGEQAATLSWNFQPLLLVHCTAFSTQNTENQLVRFWRKQEQESWNKRERVCVVHARARVHEVSLKHRQNLYQGISVMERLKRQRKRLGVMRCWPLCTYVHHFPSGRHAVVVVTRPNGHKNRLNYDVF